MKDIVPTGLLAKICHALTFPWRARRHFRVMVADLAALRQLNQELTDFQQLLLQEVQALKLQYAEQTKISDRLRRDHDAGVAWLQANYPELVAVVEKKPGRDLFDQLAQDVFAAVHREIGVVMDRLGALESGSGVSVHKQVSTDDSRSIGFYLELERKFRGTAQDVALRAQPYLTLLQSNVEAYTPILDVGSGRGEWLALLSQNSLPASGVDLNPINGDFCRSRGLNVVTGDAIAHLASLPAQSIGTVSAFHLVEHLPFGLLIALTDEILRVLKPGGLLIYETPNPENLLVSSLSFWIDPTHIRPLPPDLLQFLVEQRGFPRSEIRRLHPGEPVSTADPAVQALLSGPRDYAILAYKAW